jgi:hypothetical protein
MAKAIVNHLYGSRNRVGVAQTALQVHALIETRS